MTEYFLMLHDMSADCSITVTTGDVTPPEGYVDERGDRDSRIPPDLRSGKPWPEDQPYPIFTYDFEKPPCDFSSVANGSSIVLAGIREVMEAFNVKAQFFEVKVTVKGRDYDEKQMYVLHHLSSLPYIDLKKSDLHMEENMYPDTFSHGRITTINQLVLVPDVLDAVDLCTYEGRSKLMVHTLVSEHLKNALEARNFSGMKFVNTRDLRADEDGWLLH